MSLALTARSVQAKMRGMQIRRLPVVLLLGVVFASGLLIGEGTADIFAMYLYDDPIVGQDFCGRRCGQFVPRGHCPMCAVPCHCPVPVIPGRTLQRRGRAHQTLACAARTG